MPKLVRVRRARQATEDDAAGRGASSFLAAALSPHTVQAMKRLVITEKPSVAADVARALSGTNAFERTDWGFSSDAYLITSATGHLVAELAPDGYDDRFKQWVLDDLPILPDPFEYEPRDQRAAGRLRQLKTLCHRSDVTEIVSATDAGREGELIFKLIIQFVEATKPITRAWFSSMTTPAILTAFSNLRPDSEMKPLEAAARCRAEADWMVGMNATRAATLTLGGGRTMLSLGRVQTPTLSLVVHRDVAIEQFVPEDFFVLRGDFSVDVDGTTESFTGWWRSGRDSDAADRTSGRDELDVVAAAVKAAGKGRIADVEVKPEMVAPPRLFDLTDLQREANKRFGMTATRTLAAAQACYEEHKVLSYPRTDSRFLPSDMEAGVVNLVRRVRAADADYHAAADALLPDVDASRLINDAKISDHHAIVPTDAAHDLSKLTDDQRKIYDLVARRLLASLLPAQELERTVVWVDVSTGDDADDTAWFRAAGRREVTQGWRLAWPEASKGDDGDDNEDDRDLPALTVNMDATVDEAEVLGRKTKPPAYFNEASLLAAMASAGKFVEDDDAADAMKESGLGTPATRASIIERLVKVEYLERKGRQLRATDKGRGVVLALGDHMLTRPALTGSWEQRLRELEQADPADVDDLRQRFDDAVRAFAGEVVDGLTGMEPTLMQAGRRVLVSCPMPDCDGDIIEGRKAWGCTSWRSRDETGCGFAFWKQQSGKKKTEKQMLAFAKKVAEGKETVTPRGPRVVLGGCPRCDGEIVERAKSWGCNSWKSPKETGCGYVLWKTNPDGSELVEEAARELLAEGKMNARERVVLGGCPRCDGEIVERAKSWGCNSWKSPKETGCGYVLWKTNPDGSELFEEDARELLAEGKMNSKPRVVFASCPLPDCDGEILDKGKVLGCDSWKSPRQPGCGVTVWRENRGTALSDAEIHEELERQGREGPPKRKPRKKAAKKR